MTSARVIDWDEDVAADPGEDYDSLVRSLQYKRGFGLFFVCCATENEEALIQKLQSDLTRKKIEIMDLKEPITNLYSLVEERYHQQAIDILFIRGLAYSLSDYELQTFGKITENQYDDFTAIPAILNHLNQQRERFRDNLPLCYVFFLPRFALRYVIKRAPDFFDWRSGNWEFPIDAKLANNKAFWIYINGDFDRYKMLSAEQQRQETLAIQELLYDDSLNKKWRINLFITIGKLLITTQTPEIALTYLQKAIELEPDNSNAWFYRWHALDKLGKHEEAIIAYDQAFKLQSKHRLKYTNNYYYLYAWNKKGTELLKSRKYETSIKAYDRVLSLNSDKNEYFYAWDDPLEGLTITYDISINIELEYYKAWYNRGIALGNLGEYEKAIASYDRALEINPDNHYVWDNRGIALAKLNRYEEAINSHQKALAINPNDEGAYYNLACAYALQQNLPLALKNLQQAINLDSKYQDMAKTDSDFDLIRDHPQFQALLKN